MAKLGKPVRRAFKRVTLGWRLALLEHTPPWLQPDRRQARVYLDMLLIDHGIFRLFYLNAHRDRRQGMALRAASAASDRRVARTRASRRSSTCAASGCAAAIGSSRTACERYGIRLVNFQVRSRAAPRREELRGARELFERIEYPILMHCKSGADRAGLMSVLYCFLKEGVPLPQAVEQLSVRYGHFRQAETGVLDAFFERYLADNAKRPMPFFDWVETVYDPDELKRTFQSKGWANRLVNTVLRRE